MPHWHRDWRMTGHPCSGYYFLISSGRFRAPSSSPGSPSPSRTTPTELLLVLVSTSMQRPICHWHLTVDGQSRCPHGVADGRIDHPHHSNGPLSLRLARSGTACATQTASGRARWQPEGQPVGQPEGQPGGQPEVSSDYWRPLRFSKSGLGALSDPLALAAI
jgi:hypothetical protein